MLRERFSRGGDNVQTMETIAIGTELELDATKMQKALEARLRAQGYGYAGGVSVSERRKVYCGFQGHSYFRHEIAYPTGAWPERGDEAKPTGLTSAVVYCALEEIEGEILDALTMHARLTLLVAPQEELQF